MTGWRREIADVQSELDAEAEWVRRSEWAELDGRVTDRAEWQASLERRRARVRELEARRDELIGLEESEAELGGRWGGEAA